MNFRILTLTQMIILSCSVPWPHGKKVYSLTKNIDENHNIVI